MEERHRPSSDEWCRGSNEAKLSAAVNFIVLGLQMSCETNLRCILEYAQRICQTLWRTIREVYNPMNIIWAGRLEYRINTNNIATAKSDFRPCNSTGSLLPPALLSHTSLQLSKAVSRPRNAPWSSSSFFLNACQRPTCGAARPGIVDLKRTDSDEPKKAIEHENRLR